MGLIMKKTKWVMVEQIAFRTIAVEVAEASESEMKEEAEEFAFEEGESGWDLDTCNATQIKESLTKEYCRCNDIEMFEMDQSEKGEESDEEEE